MLMTATGKAYLTFCPENEREQILDLLKSRDDQQGELAKNDDYVRRVLRETRDRGYGANYGEWGEEGRIGAIARPIMNKDRVMGCLNLVYIAQAMSIEEAAEKHLGKMVETITKIESRL